MFGLFNKTAKKSAPAPRMAEPLQTLTDWGANWSMKPDGSIVVHGNLSAAGKGLTALPEMSHVIVEGDFDCSDNQLASLTGAPRNVGGSFLCSNNPLKSLAGAPEKSVCFYCVNTDLESLGGGPREVTGDCWYTAAKLTSLAGAPEKFGHLGTDFGEFKTPADIPPALLNAAPTAAPEPPAVAPAPDEPLRVYRPLSFVKRNAAAV